MDVRVKRAGLFNGAGHKSLGWHEPGDIIDIPRGPYLDSLLTDGWVELMDASEPQVDGPADDSLLHLVDEGKLNRRVYQVLAAAGYYTLADIRKADDEELLAISGIGPGVLRKLRALESER